MISIFDKVCKNNIQDKLAFCSGLEMYIDDGKPRVICKCCLDNLHIAYHFKHICRKNDKLFFELLKKDKKIEAKKVNIDGKTKIESAKHIKTNLPRIEAAVNAIPIVNIDDADDNCSTQNEHNFFDDNNDFENHQSDVENLFNDDGLLKDNNGVMDKENGDDDDDFFWHNDEDIIGDSNTIKNNTIRVKVIKKPTAKHNATKVDNGIHKMKNCVAKTNEIPKINTVKRPNLNISTKESTECCPVIRRRGPFNRYCKSCDKTFKTVEDCARHKDRVHGGVCSSAICEVCGKTFQESSIKRHMGTHHPPKSACPRPGCKYQCEFCPSSYMLRKTWRKHLIKAHRIVPPIEKGGKRKNRVVEIHRLKDAGAAISQTSDTLEQKKTVETDGAMSQTSGTLEWEESVPSTDCVSEFYVVMDDVAHTVDIDYIYA